jgi:ABC-type amino acid transport substrate-binding protein
MRSILLIITLVCVLPCKGETLNIAVPGYAPPFVIRLGGHNQFTGFSIELMKAVCVRINATCDFKAMSFYKVLEEVGNAQMDLGVGNYSITSEREMFISFTKPIMPSYLQFITLTSSPINTIQDIKGKTVGIELLSVALTVAKQQFQDDVKIINFHTRL